MFQGQNKERDYCHCVEEMFVGGKMEEKKVKRGGARPGAGRKNRGHKAFNIKCTEEEKVIMIKALNDYRAIHGGLPYKPKYIDGTVTDNVLEERELTKNKLENKPKSMYD